ncbi:tRNA uridine-5-carboxymethylaminomethyl(34) synthesis GTPase MnmE [Armatimonas rosea]|uniref:tRNA modification GTPase MnmE n=1 Tax=Armatimonas rosea TaxID=685828 RepID=A0A7W9SV32_ARMRO|nr:tRNA uridine-5-carboxymethylaminomethyl(34) synthesis GTPase MnmE [Armatimonas rosea]MBB6052764.1 tRNA modification GTPase [Armatimonas rosea]
MTDTIAAIATATGAAGVGIVRLSGPNARTIAAQVVRRSLQDQPPRLLKRATVYDPQSGESLDDGLLVHFIGPHSFTGEDVVEFQGHGGMLTLAQVLQAFLAAGARLARPGEFSERAFHNGKLDLAQAEALADLISARSVAAQRAARRQLDGSLSQEAHRIAAELQEALARLEATIDFPEDVGELVPETVEAPLGRAAQRLERLLAGAAYGRRLTEGLTVALTGAPNVGKSSLLNALAGAERAIVTELAGTTRDILAEELVLAGVPVRVLDTAGLRETDDPVERIGVARARAAVATADVVIVVVDATRPEPLALPEQSFVIAVNKSDLASPELERFAPHPAVAISARTGEGLDALVQAVIGTSVPASDAPLLTRARHEDALRRAAAQIHDARVTLALGLPAELIAVDTHGALAALGELTGQTTREEIIQGIFSRFCIGK